MSSMVMLFLLGMAGIFAGERLFDAYETLRWGLDLGGLITIGVSMFMRVKARAAHTNDGVREAHRRVLLFQSVALLALAVYAISTRGFIELAGMEGEMATRWRGVWGAVWPAVWTIGTVPLLTLDRAIDSSPVLMPMRRVQQAMNNGLIAALGVCLVFPVNFVASRHTQEWDFSYFQTAKPGTATVSIANSLEETVTVRIFQPTSSEVLPEIQKYFSRLNSPNLKVEVLDQAAEPKLARYLRVSNNGFIVFTKGEVNPDEPDASKKPSTQLVDVGVELRKARPKLKKLDGEVGKALLAMARGQLTAYVTQGHGELTWEKGTVAPKAAEGVKQLLEIWNFKVKKLSITEGLANEVPSDADVVLVLGPTKAFLEAETQALRRYLDQGGSLLLAVEPLGPAQQAMGGDGLDGLLSELGVKREPGLMASTQQIVALARNKIDRVNITTSTFSTHPSTVVLADERARVFASGSGSLDLVPNSKAKVTKTVRTQATTWADLNGDLEFNQGVETKKSYTIAAASTGGKDEDAWRAIVTADATMFSDLAIVVGGNQQLLSDGLNWLTRTESLSGTTESEEDIKIQHSKEGQAGWFYATVMGFPFFILVLGIIRTRRRKSGGEA